MVNVFSIEHLYVTEWHHVQCLIVPQRQDRNISHIGGGNTVSDNVSVRVSTLTWIDNNCYHQTSNISHILVENKIVDHYIFILDLTPGFNQLDNGNCNRDKNYLSFGIWCDLFLRFDSIFLYIWDQHHMVWNNASVTIQNIFIHFCPCNNDSNHKRILFISILVAIVLPYRWWNIISILTSNLSVLLTNINISSVQVMWYVQEKLKNPNELPKSSGSRDHPGSRRSQCLCWCHLHIWLYERFTMPRVPSRIWGMDPSGFC